MFTPARPSVSASSATTPGRLGTARRSSRLGAAGAGRRRAGGGGPRRPAPARPPAPPGRPRRRGRAPPAGAPPRRRARRRARRRWRRRSRARAPGALRRRAWRRGSSARSGQAGGRPADGRVRLEGADGLAGQDVGDHVREVGDGGHDAVVVDGVEGHGARPQPGEQPVEPLEQDARRRGGRRQVPRGLGEEVAAGVLDAGGLGPGQGVAAHEALVADRGHDGPLDRPDVGDDAARRGGGERGADRRLERSDGRGRRTRRRRPRRPPRGSRSIASAAPARTGRPPAAGSYPRTVAPSRPRAARPTDPPMSPTPTTATFTRPPARSGGGPGGAGGRPLAGDRRGLLDLVRVGGELARPQLLRAVADRVARGRGGLRR